LNVILKKDAFQIETEEDKIIIKKVPKTKNEMRHYSAIETKTPDFNELRNNLERSINKAREDSLGSKEPRQSSIAEKKQQGSQGPISENESKPSTSGGQRKSWVLASSTPQTKPFEEEKSEENDEEEGPREPHKAPEDDSIIPKVKDNPFVRGNSPGKPVTVAKTTTVQETVVKKTLTESSNIVKKKDER